MRIDAYTHFFPAKYFDNLLASKVPDIATEPPKPSFRAGVGLATVTTGTLGVALARS